jgi:hypothetical protein
MFVALIACLWAALSFDGAWRPLSEAGATFLIFLSLAGFLRKRRSGARIKS